MLDSLMNILTSGAAGGVTGLIGAGATAYSQYKTQKLSYSHEIEKAQLDHKFMIAEADKAIKVQEARTEGEIAVGELEVLKSSYEDINKSLFDKSYMEHMPKWAIAIVGTLFGLMDVLKTSVRPVLAYYLVIVMSYMGFLAYRVDPTVFSNKGEAIVTTTMYLAVSAVTWWYADRRIQKSLDKVLGG